MINHLKPLKNLLTIDIHNEQPHIELIIAKKIMLDFNDFKNKNELTECSLKQSKLSNNVIDVVWKIKTIYNKSIENERIQNDFKDFAQLNKEDFCQVSNIDLLENKIVVEYSIYRNYQLNFVFYEENNALKN